MIIDGGGCSVDPSQRAALKKNTIVTCHKSWEGLTGPLQVVRNGFIGTVVWVIEGGYYTEVPLVYLKEQPFMRAVYYRRHGWLKRLRPYWFEFAKNTQLVEFR